MRKLLLLLAATLLGCQAYTVDASFGVEQHVAALAAMRPLPECATDSVVLPTAATASLPTLPSVDFAVLWSLALVHNPTLREAAAELEAARGRHLQAAKYPNPRLAYSQENLGTSMGPAGA